MITVVRQEYDDEIEDCSSSRHELDAKALENLLLIYNSIASVYRIEVKDAKISNTLIGNLVEKTL